MSKKRERQGDGPGVTEPREYRMCEATELRAEPEIAGKKKKLTGYAAVFGQTVDLGWFRERIDPGAFSESLGNRDDVYFLVNHDSNQRLARLSAGNLRLREDSRGLLMEAELPDTPLAQTTYEEVRLGMLTKMSFGFQPLDEEFAREDGIPLRVLKRVKLWDVSVVNWPAYDQTKIEANSLAAVEARAREWCRSRGLRTPDLAELDEKILQARLTQAELVSMVLAV